MSDFRERYRTRLEQIATGLSTDPSSIVELSDADARETLAYLLQQACQPQNGAPILFAREFLSEIPSDWLVHRVPDMVAEVLDLNDYWQSARLLELYREIDAPLADQHRQWCQQHADPDVRDIAQ